MLLRDSWAVLPRRSYDPAGALTITGALVLLVYAVVEAPGADWGDVRTIMPLGGSAVLVAAFALIESRHPAPLVPLRIFRSRTLAGADGLTILIGTVAVGMPFVLTLYARQVLGYSALKFGISPVVLRSGPRPARSPARPRSARPASARPARPAWRSWPRGRSCSRRSPDTAATSRTSFVGLLLCGLGTGLAFVTATVAALAGVAEHEGGLASGLSNTALQTGTALGVAIVTTVAVSAPSTT